MPKTVKRPISRSKPAPVIVSVIIVSYNTRDLTVKSIRSAYASKGFKSGEIEVIVIDNYSADDTVAYLKKHLPQSKLIANSKNVGFGGGNNQGVAVAQGRYILLLNTDAFLEPDSLKTMVDILESRPEISSVGPQLRYADGSLQQSAGYSPTPWRVLAWMWWLDKLPLIKQLVHTPYHVFDLSWYEKSHTPDWLMGACVLFRRSEFLAAGGFDDQIFMYAEEVELYRRLAQTTGKNNFFTADTWVTHLGSASTKKANAFRLTYELRGIEYIYRKHYAHLYWFIKFVIVTGVLLRMALYTLIPSRHEALAEYQKYFKVD